MYHARCGNPECDTVHEWNVPPRLPVEGDLIRRDLLEQGLLAAENGDTRLAVQYLVRWADWLEAELSREGVAQGR